jgi:hypothetical protein
MGLIVLLKKKVIWQKKTTRKYQKTREKKFWKKMRG